MTWQILLKKELQCFKTDLSSWLFSIAFYLLSLITYKFIANNNSNSELDILFLLLFFIFSHLLFISFGNDDDLKYGIYEQFLLKGGLFEVVITKYLMSILASLLFLAIIYPFILLFIDLKPLEFLNLAITLLMLIPLINLFILFASILLLGENRKQCLSLVVLPFIMPLIILAIAAITDFQFLFAIAGIFLINLPIMLFITTKIVADFIHYK